MMRSYVAAGTLALLTLGVFWALRDYGPEAALRRFHQAAIQSDWNEMERVSVHGQGSDSQRQLAARVRLYNSAGARLASRKIERYEPHAVLIEVAYVLGNRADVIFWVLRHEPAGWQVDTDATLNFRAVPAIGFNRRQ